MDSKKKYRLGFVGAGKMAQALATSAIGANAVAKNEIICSDTLKARRQEIKERLEVAVTDDNDEVLGQCDIVVLAVKPQNFPQAVTSTKIRLGGEQIIVSIMAGVRIETIQQYLANAAVVRVMPNTACLVGQMAGAMAAAENVSDDDMAAVKKILDTAGMVTIVTEDQLDAVTALSGSGPAFVAYLIEKFIDAGCHQGLERKVATELTIQTFKGTAQLLEQWKMPPSELIKMVSSPNGTTVAGRQILETTEMGNLISETIAASCRRSEELGK